MIIAIDGPAASGKGTLSAKRLARALRLRAISTPACSIAAVAKAVLDRRADRLIIRRPAIAAAKALDPCALRWSGAQGRRRRQGRIVRLGDPRGARRAGRLAAELSRRRRRAPCSTAATSAPSSCPDADVKIFVTATAQERARAAGSSNCGSGATRSTSRRSWPTSSSGTSAT